LTDNWYTVYTSASDIKCMGICP